MGLLTVKTTVAPASEPVTLQDVKRHLRVDWDDDDDYLRDVITSARDWLERKIDRALITRTLVAVFDLTMAHAAAGPVGGTVTPYPLLAFPLPQPPLGTVSQVELEQDVELWKTLTLTTDYVVDPDHEPQRVWLHSSALSVWMPSWDWTGAQSPRCRITYTAGYGTAASSVPAPLRRALLHICAHLYENREAGGVIPDSLAMGTGYLTGWL